MGSSATRARRAAILALVAGVLLANPLYIGFIFDDPKTRSPTGYSSKVIDPTVTPDADIVIGELGDDEILRVGTLLEGSDSNPYGSRYEAPMAAANVLETAQQDRLAMTDRDDVSFTLHRLDANYEFAAFPGSDGMRYARFDVAQRNGSTVVTVRDVSRSTVARYIVYDDARRYSALPRYEQQVVDTVMSAGDNGYRPYEDEEFTHLTDDLVIKDGTYYVFVERIHVDDFGFDRRTVASVLLYASGGVLFLVAAILTAMSND